jgi:hypothetical protein
MAEQLYQAPSQGGGFQYRIKNVIYLGGAAVSLGLIAGAVYWAVTMTQRDISKIPVVAARAEPMRIAPENPGGQAADHMDLTVSRVAATETPQSVESVVVSSMPPDLDDTDVPQAELIAAQESQASFTEQEKTVLDMNALADAMTQGVEPLSALPQPSAIPNIVQGNIDDALRLALSDQATTGPLVVDGLVQVSLRPKARPALQQATAIAAAAPADAVSPTPTAPKVVVGSALVQLGAFDTSQAAHDEWDQLAAALTAVIGDRKPVIEQANSGGRPFYRLRAAGFQDLADARRFCSAVASKTDCIPVLAR